MQRRLFSYTKGRDAYFHTPKAETTVHVLIPKAETPISIHHSLQLFHTRFHSKYTSTHHHYQTHRRTDHLRRQNSYKHKTLLTMEPFTIAFAWAYLCLHAVGPNEDICWSSKPTQNRTIISAKTQVDHVFFIISFLTFEDAISSRREGI